MFVVLFGLLFYSAILLLIRKCEAHQKTPLHTRNDLEVSACCLPSAPQGALILKIIRGKYPAVSGYSKDLIDVVKSCLTQNVHRRPDTDKLLTLKCVEEQHTDALLNLFLTQVNVCCYGVIVGQRKNTVRALVTTAHISHRTLMRKPSIPLSRHCAHPRYFMQLKQSAGSWLSASSALHVDVLVAA